MELGDDYSNLVYLAGSLFTKVSELNALMERLAESGQCQGEIHLAHRQANGETTQLLIHIDGNEFTMMPGDSDSEFRLDISGLSTQLESPDSSL